MSGTDPETLRRMANDPEAVMALLSVALPNVYYDDRRILTPGRFAGALGQVYGTSQAEKDLEAARTKGLLEATQASRGPGQLSQAGPGQYEGAAPQGETSATATSPSLTEQAQYRPKRMFWPGFMLSLTPQQRRSVARVGGPAGEGLEREYTAWGKQAEGMEQDRRQGLLNQVLLKLADAPYDLDAQNALMVLSADPGSKMAFQNPATHRAQVAVLRRMNPGLSFEGAYEMVLSGLFTSEFSKSERIKQGRELIRFLKTQRSMSPKELTTLERMNDLGALDGPTLQFVQNSAQNDDYHSMIQEFPEVMSAWGVGIPVEQEVLQAMTSKFPKLTKEIQGSNLKALEMFQSERHRSYERGMSAARLGLASEQLKLEAERLGLSVQELAIRKVQMALTALQAARMELGTPPAGLSPDQMKAWLAAARANVEEMRNGVEHAFQQYNLLNNPLAVLSSDRGRFDRELTAIQDSTKPAANRASSLNIVERNLDASYQLYLSKVPGGAEYYQEAKRRIAEIRRHIEAGDKPEPPTKKERGFPWKYIDPLLPAPPGNTEQQPQIPSTGPEGMDWNSTQVPSGPPEVTLPRAGTREQAIPLDAQAAQPVPQKPSKEKKYTQQQMDIVRQVFRDLFPDESELSVMRDPAKMKAVWDEADRRLQAPPEAVY